MKGDKLFYFYDFENLVLVYTFSLQTHNTILTVSYNLR